MFTYIYGRRKFLRDNAFELRADLYHFGGGCSVVTILQKE